MSWYTRHPGLRMLFGCLLHLLVIIGYSYTGGALFDISTSFLNMSVSSEVISILNFLYIGLLLGSSLVVSLYMRNKAKSETIQFDSKPTGKKISNTIRKICEKNNLSVPERSLGSGYYAGTRYWARARCFPIAQINISKDLYNKYKHNKVTQENLERVIGHELGHIHYKHSLVVSPWLAITYIFSFLIQCSFALSALLCLNMAMGALFYSTVVSVDALTLLGHLQLVSFSALVLNRLSEITGNIISRAAESQAELASCEFTSPKDVYLINLLYANYEFDSRFKKSNKKCNNNSSIIDKIYDKKKTFLKYYRSWLNTHPTTREDADDIALYYPEVKNNLNFLQT